MASMTAREVIRNAARRCRILAGEETMTAAEQTDALTDFNLMLHAFPSMGIAYAHADLGAADTVNMPDAMLDNLVWLAAEKMATGDYGGALLPADQMKIDAAKQALQAFYHVQNRAVIDHALRKRVGAINFARGI